MSEDAGDFFDRQRKVPDWDNDVIASQAALVLGVGGESFYLFINNDNMIFLKKVKPKVDVMHRHQLICRCDQAYRLYIVMSTRLLDNLLL